MLDRIDHGLAGDEEKHACERERNPWQSHIDLQLELRPIRPNHASQVFTNEIMDNFGIIAARREVMQDHVDVGQDTPCRATYFMQMPSGATPINVDRVACRITEQDKAAHA